MKISIITPVYNASKYLSNMIESILEQTYKNYELILIDDGSTDDSYKIMQQYSKNSQIKIFKKKNSGPGFTRKYGYERSTGDLLFFVDSDDWLENNTVLERINTVFEEQKNIDLLVFDRKIYPSNEVLHPFKNKLTPGIYSIDDLYNNNIRGGLGLKIFKRDIFTSEMFSNSSNYEDYYTTYLYFDRCQNFYYCNEIFYAINRYEDNISLTKTVTVKKSIQAMENIINMYNIVNNKSLKQSIASLALTGYIGFYFKTIIKFNLKFNEIKKIKKLGQELKIIICKNELDFFINKMSKKQKIFYKIFINKERC